MNSFLRYKSVFLFIIAGLLSFFLINSRFKEKIVTICFVGDIIPHKEIVIRKQDPQQLRKDFVRMFVSVARVINKADIAVGNLEGPVASVELKHKHRMAFNGNEYFLSGLKQAGFDILNIANNHVFDCGYKGFLQTIHNLKQHDFMVTGYTVNEKVQMTVYHKHDIKIGFIGFTFLLNWKALSQVKTNVSYIQDQVPEKLIRDLSTQVDYLIASVHWGEEYKGNTGPLKKAADKFFQAGVDCIIGHHPHILLPIEYLKNNNQYSNIVAYSLGNFMANIGRKYRPFSNSVHGGIPDGPNRRSIILTLEIKKINDRVMVTDIRTDPVWIHNNYYQYKAGKEKERWIYPLLLDDVPEAVLSDKEKKYERKLIFKALKEGSP